MKTKGEIDHIVYAVPDLEQAMDWFENLTGVRPVFGGYHTTQGTKNALVRLGEICYLEFLAIDDKNTQILAPRWMGIDVIKKPQITRWAAKSMNLEADSIALKKSNAAMGMIQGGERQLNDGNILKWRLTMPLPEPVVEIIPFMIDWQDSAAHPTDKLPQQCELITLQLTHPNPDLLQKRLNKPYLGVEITKGTVSRIKAIIKCSKGMVEI